MAQNDTRKLDAGDPFPDFPVHLVDESSTTIMSALGGSWSVLLLYRGHW
jgi:peroxiredoxin